METEKFFGHEFWTVLLFGTLILIVGIISSVIARADTEAHGISLVTLTAGNDAPGGVIVRSYRYNWTLVNLTKQGNVATPDKCYVWPNGTSYNYGTPLATGTFSGNVCTFSSPYNVSVNTSIIIAMDRVSGSYNSYNTNPASGMPGIQGNITTWMGGVYSNSIETTFSLYPTALIDVIAIGVINRTSPVPPEPSGTLAVSINQSYTTNQTAFLSWNTTGFYAYSVLWRNNVIVYNSTLKFFTDTGLVPDTTYTYNLTVVWNSTLQNSTVLNLTTMANTPVLSACNLTNVYADTQFIRGELTMLPYVVAFLTLFWMSFETIKKNFVSYAMLSFIGANVSFLGILSQLSMNTGLWAVAGVFFIGYVLTLASSRPVMG